MYNNENWREYTLEEICLRKGQYGIAESSIPYQSDLPRYLRITDITDDGFLKNDGKVSVSVNANQYEKYLLEKNDIVFARTGASAGRSYVYEETVEPLIVAGFLIRYKLNPIIVDPRFMRYFTISSDYKNWVDSIATGSTRPNINQKMFSSMKILLPSMGEQKRIVEILDSLENKVKKNNTMITILEEQAQAIFKSWFIDFEARKDEEFVDSELGRLPKGWQVNSLENIATFKNGIAMQKFRPETKQDSLPVLKIKELRANKTDSSSDRCAVDIPKEVLIENGDIIFSWSGSLLVEVWTGGTAGLNQHLFKVSSNKYNKWFYYYWTKFFLNQFVAIARDRATTMGHIKRSHLKEAKVLIPDDVTLGEMDKVMNPIVSKIINLGVQNKKLEELRDTLLPKLMSGEIRIEEAVETE
ncbi:type I restriction enzyme, S subunit [Alkalibacterium putridalgicola]|uniref:Type I restriction enzyme, S subunit n=1 Tax=Alkalibacterium putridalgicola TaxID=426703 RepID=A0A1H7VAN4_9LACT|nr:restriction endonuclease subunit S [Alkalibacterium putridalgicola]GEK88625.1 hypothetical protein APU01nite_06640 [Alkalibacterium putridalgicola]SEM06246.1 type I restriction enzyme, S subunit [Alkalibacterium putridalgicola]